MLIVYGAGNYMKKGKELGTSICPNCGYTTAKMLGKEKFKIHIFYIPIFLMTRRKGIICGCCGMYRELNSKEYKELSK